MGNTSADLQLSLVCVVLPIHVKMFTAVNSSSKRECSYISKDPMFFFRKRSQAFRKNTRIGLIKNILVTMVTNTSSIQSMTLNFLKSTRGRGKPSTHFSRGLLSHAARELGDSRRRDASASQACKLLGQRLRHEVVGNLLVCRRQFCSSEVVAAPHHILLICWNRAEVGLVFLGRSI